MTRQEQLNYCARVRSRLARRPRNLEYVHIATALNIPLEWVKAFGRGRYEIPNLDYVKKVDNYLSKLRDA